MRNQRHRRAVPRRRPPISHRNTRTTASSARSLVTVRACAAWRRRFQHHLRRFAADCQYRCPDGRGSHRHDALDPGHGYQRPRDRQFLERRRRHRGIRPPAGRQRVQQHARAGRWPPCTSQRRDELSGGRQQHPLGDAGADRRARPRAPRSTYGSDAVAGVVNFITRKSFDGIQVQAQGSTASGTNGTTPACCSDSTGTPATSSARSAIRETRSSPIPRGRGPIRWPSPRGAAADGLVGTGATNFGNFNCNPATIQAGGSGPIFLNAQGSTSVANAAANQTCTNWAYGALLPQDTRVQAMIRVNDDPSPRPLVPGGCGLRQPDLAADPVPGPPDGHGLRSGLYDESGADQSVLRESPWRDRDQADDLDTPRRASGPGALSLGGGTWMYGLTTLDYKVTSDWTIDFLGMVGRSNDYAG